MKFLPVNARSVHAHHALLKAGRKHFFDNSSSAVASVSSAASGEVAATSFLAAGVVKSCG